MNTIEELRQELSVAEKLSDMMANSEGWRVVLQRYDNIRKALFEQWSNLEDADENKAVQLRMKEKAVRSFMEELVTLAKSAPDIRERIQDLEKSEREKSMMEAMSDNVPDEVKRLTGNGSNKPNEIWEFLKSLPTAFGGGSK